MQLHAQLQQKSNHYLLHILFWDERNQTIVLRDFQRGLHCGEAEWYSKPEL